MLAFYFERLKAHALTCHTALPPLTKTNCYYPFSTQQTGKPMCIRPNGPLQCSCGKAAISSWAGPAAAAALPREFVRNAVSDPITGLLNQKLHFDQPPPPPRWPVCSLQFEKPCCVSYGPMFWWGVRADTERDSEHRQRVPVYVRRVDLCTVCSEIHRFWQ